MASLFPISDIGVLLRLSSIFNNLGDHGNGEGHRRCMFIYTERVKESGHIDTELVKQLKVEQQYWPDVLKQVIP